MLAQKLGLSLPTIKSLGGVTPAQAIVNAFMSRVIADGGVFEAKACLNAQLITLNNIQ